MGNGAVCSLATLSHHGAIAGHDAQLISKSSGQGLGDEGETQEQGCGSCCFTHTLATRNEMHSSTLTLFY